MNQYLLCCDWGTSSFRLRLVARNTLAIEAEIITQDGIATTFNAWENATVNNKQSREQYFKLQLKKQLANLRAKTNISLADIPILISGMASSSLGMKELSYANIPFAIDGSQANIAQFEPQADFPHEIILISGVKSEADVMRGEETQLIGLVHLLGKAGLEAKSAIFIFPGTHSKHIEVQNGQLVAFQTFMTGEVFNLLSNQSILKDSIEIGENELSASELTSFKAGVRESSEGTLLNSLFKVRTNHLFNILEKQQNFYYLSGLLIGTELRTLQPKNGQLILCSGNNLFEFYQLAISELNLESRTQTVLPEIIDKAAIAGQFVIFQQHTTHIKAN